MKGGFVWRSKGAYFRDVMAPELCAGIPGTERHACACWCSMSHTWTAEVLVLRNLSRI